MVAGAQRCLPASVAQACSSPCPCPSTARHRQMCPCHRERHQEAAGVCQRCHATEVAERTAARAPVLPVLLLLLALEMSLTGQVRPCEGYSLCWAVPSASAPPPALLSLCHSASSSRLRLRREREREPMGPECHSLVLRSLSHQSWQAALEQAEATEPERPWTVVVAKT